MATAAWLVTISFIIDNYLSGNASPNTVVKNIKSHLVNQENDFDHLAADTALINRLATNKYDEETLRRITDKKYFLFFFHKLN